MGDTLSTEGLGRHEPATTRLEMRPRGRTTGIQATEARTTLVQATEPQKAMSGLQSHRKPGLPGPQSHRQRYPGHRSINRAVWAKDPRTPLVRAREPRTGRRDTTSEVRATRQWWRLPPQHRGMNMGTRPLPTCLLC